MTTEIRRVDAGYELRSTQWVPQPVDRVFAFFSDAANLELLTPKSLQFEILTPNIEMAVGARIDYRLRLLGVPLRWQSEITAWDPPNRFIDEQRRGPYRHWRHEHRFGISKGGTRVQDTVHYAVPGGSVVHVLFVKWQLRHIFRHRARRLQEVLHEHIPDPRAGNDKPGA